eukprot:gene8627-biopygen19654
MTCCCAPQETPRPPAGIHHTPLQTAEGETTPPAAGPRPVFFELYPAAR